ncbi:hypothetical protein CMV_020860 [Castanea mollissima]|uniref:Uncharacterized protein n=1 Tax=Castanea mollissima TaxID=60419 RepID=A0A8J4QKT2_9ROSI|nr:hypothetical protein CMV_020860 [Castanea mollissima]
MEISESRTKYECPKPKATVSSCVRSSTHTSSAVDDLDDDEDKEDDVTSNWWVTRTRTRTLELLWYKSLASSVFSAQVLLGSSESIRGGKIL